MLNHDPSEFSCLTKSQKDLLNVLRHENNKEFRERLFYSGTKLYKKILFTGLQDVGSGSSFFTELVAKDLDLDFKTFDFRLSESRALSIERLINLLHNQSNLMDKLLLIRMFEEETSLLLENTLLLRTFEDFLIDSFPAENRGICVITAKRYNSYMSILQEQYDNFMKIFDYVLEIPCFGIEQINRLIQFRAKKAGLYLDQGSAAKIADTLVIDNLTPAVVNIICDEAIKKAFIKGSNELTQNDFFEYY